MTSIWSANGLIEAPDVVRDIHRDYISAGADIITTNTYGLVRRNLAKEGCENLFEVLSVLACGLAEQARQQADSSVLIAGSLPPLAGSYRPDLVGEIADMVPLYLEQTELLAPHVDLILCETMSTAAEGKAAATAACQSGKPVWVAWTLHDDRSGRLRSGETIEVAIDMLSGLPVSGFLVNCCAPESITKAIPRLKEAGVAFIGGYANTFEPVPGDWSLDGGKQTDGALDLRFDLDPDSYAAHCAHWLQAGANVIGGCCGTGPAHIERLHDLIQSLPARG